MSKFSTIIANTNGYEINPQGIKASFKTPLELWESEYAAMAHGISTNAKNLQCTEPLAYYFAAIKGMITDASHPIVKRSNQVFWGCDIYSKSAIEFDYVNRKNGNRGTIKYNNNEINLIEFVNSIRHDSV
jgi:hypothetical protein